MASVAGPIIVGYDGSDAARQAVRTALTLRGPGAVVTVVHAYEVPFQVDVYPWFSDFRDTCSEVAKEVLESARGVAGDDEQAIHYEIVEGRPAEVLARRAEELSAQMIVVGSRGMGPVLAAIGSVTLRLLHQAPCPVVVVPSSAEP